MPKQLNVSLAFSADTSAAKRQIQDLQNALDKIAKGQSRSGGEFYLTRDLRQASQAAAELQTYISKATNINTGTLDLTKFAESIRQSGMSLADYQAKLSSMGIEGERAFMKLAQSISLAEVPLKRTSAVLDQFKVTLMNTARWQISSSVLHGFMGAVSSAYNYAKNLNESLNNIRIVTGQSSEQMAEFADRANKAAQALSTTTVRYTDAALIYYQQGIRDQEEIAKRTDTTIKMMNVSGQNAEQASSQMTAIWNNFYDGSKSLEFYADAITALGAATASSSQEIATGIEKFAAVADTVGLSYEYATAALATITAQTRQSADTVGTSLRTLFSRLEGLKLGETLEDGVDLNKYSAALKTIGVDILDVNGELKNMDTILDETAAHWDQLSNAQQVAFAQTVGGVRQYTNLIALMDNWDKMQQNVDIARNSEGTLQQQADIYAESWEAASTRVRAAAENIFSTLLNDDFFISLINGFEKLISSIGAFIKNIGGMKGVLITVGALVTRIFGNEIANSMQKMSYNLQMMTKKGPSKMATQMKDDALNAIKNSGINMDNKEGTAMQQTYSRIAEVQQSYLQNANKMSEAEQEINQRLMARNQLLAEEAIKAGAAADAAEKELEHATNSLQLQEKIASKQNKGSSEDWDNYDNTKEIFDTMSNGYKELLNLKTELNTIDLTTEDIEQYNERISNLKNEFQQLANEAREAGDDATADSFEGMAQSLENVELTSKNTDQTLDQLDAAIDLTQVETNKAGAAFAEAGTKVGIAQSILDRYKEGTLSAAEAEVLLTAKLGSANKALDQQTNSLNNASSRTISLSQSFTKMAGVIMNAAMVIQQINGLINVWNDDSTTTGQKILQTMMTIGMVVPSVMSVISTSSELASVSIAAFGTTIHLAMWEVTLIAAAIGGLIALFASLSANTPEKKLKKLKEAAEETANTFEDIHSSYTSLVEKFKQYQEIKDSLSECKKGTDEWYDSVNSLKESMQELIDLYPELAKAKKTYNPETGQLEFANEDEVNNIIADYAKRNNVTELATGLSKAVVIQEETKQAQEKITENHELTVVLDEFSRLFGGLQLTDENGGFLGNKTTAQQADFMYNLLDNLGQQLTDGTKIEIGTIRQAIQQEYEQLFGEGTFNPNALEANIAGGIDVSGLWTSIENSLNNSLSDSYDILQQFNFDQAEDAVADLASQLQAEETKGQEQIKNNLTTYLSGILEELKQDENLGLENITDSTIDEIITDLENYAFDSENGILQQYQTADINELKKKLTDAGFDLSKIDDSIIPYLTASLDAVENFFNTEADENGEYQAGSLIAILKEKINTIYDGLKESVDNDEITDENLKNIAEKYVKEGTQGFSYRDIEGIYNQIKDSKDAALSNIIKDFKLVDETLQQQTNKYTNLSKLFDFDTLSNDVFDSIVALADSFSIGPKGNEGGESLIDAIIESVSPYFGQTNKEGLDIGNELIKTIINQIQKGGPNIAESLQNAFNIQGLTFKPEEWSGLIEIINTLQWSADSFTEASEQFTIAYSTLKDLEVGDALDEEDYASLATTLGELGIAYENLFAKQADGTRKFIGTKTQLKAINDQLINNLAQEQTQLEANLEIQKKINDNEQLKYRTSEAFDKATTKDEKSHAVSAFDHGTLLEAAKAADYTQDDIRLLANDLFNEVEGAEERYTEFVRRIKEFMAQNIPEDMQEAEDMIASTATSIEDLNKLCEDDFISTETRDKWIAFFQDIEEEANKATLNTIESWEDLIEFLEQHPELNGSYEHQQVANNIGQKSILEATSYTEARQKRDVAKALGTEDWLADAMYNQRTQELVEENIKAAKSFEELEKVLKEYEEETGKSADNLLVTKEKYQEIADTSIAASKSIKELKEKMDEVSSKGLDINTEFVQTALADMNLSTKEVLDNLELFTSYDDAVTHIILDIEGAKDLKDVLDILNQVTAHDGANISLSMLDAANKNIHEQLQTQLTPEQTPGEQMASISQSVSTEIAELMHTGIPALQEYAQQLQASLDQFNAETPAALINTAESLEGVLDIINNLGDTQVDAALINQEHIYGLISSTEQLAQLWNLGFQDGNAYAEGLIHIAEQYDNTAAELEKYNQALQNYKNNSSEANEAALGQAEYNLELATRAGEAAAAYDLEADAVEDIAREFAATDTVLKENAELAADAATRYLRLNRGLEDLQDSYDEVCDVIGDLEKGLGREVRAADKSAKAFKTLRKGLADMLDTTEDVIDAFGDDWIKDNAEDIKKAINGDIDAIHRLQQAAGDEIQVEVGINDNGAFDEFQQKIAEAEEGADLTLDVDTNAYLQNLVWAMQMAGMTQEDIEAKLGAMGVDVDLEPMAASLNDMAAMAAEAGVAVSDNFAANAGIDTEVESSTDTQTDTTTQMGYIPHVSWKTETRQSHFAVQGEGNNLESKDVPTTVNTPIVTYEPQPQTNTADKQTTQQALKVKGATKSSGGHVSSKNTGGGGGGRGGGGGGGGGKERQAKEASKFSPKTPERYHVVTKKLTALSAAQDRLSKKQSTLFGKDYLNSIDATNKLLQKNLNLIQEESDEIDRWLKVDKEKMEAYGAMFDEDGTILNYEEIFNREADKVKAVYDAEKELIDRWNAGDESITEEMLEQAKKNIEDAEEAFSEFEEALSQYEDTIQKQQENWAKRQEAIIAIQENRYEKIATQLEYQLDIQERSLKILNYYYDKLSDNVYKAAEALRYIYSLNGTDQFDVAFNKLAAYKNATDALTNEYNTPLYDENGNKLSDHSITEANYAEGLQNAIDGVLENLTSINEAIRTMQEYYANTLSDVVSKISIYTDHMEHLTTVLEHYNTILNLTGQSKAYDKINTILKGQAKTIENTLDADKATYEMLKRQSDLQKAELEAVWADPNHTTNQLILAENEYFAVLQAMDEAHEKMLDSAEAFAEKLQEIYQNDVAKAYEGLEDSITDGMGFDLLNDSLSRLSSLDDEWLTKTNQIYETSSLIKDINKAIDDSTNAATKQKLKLFADEIDALKEKDRLSKFELDLAKARYALLQAQIALEDAQNAKSTVRLRRDNEGNYGYVYTADQNAVNDAEGDLLAAENDLYNMKLNAANEYGQKVIQARQELAEKLKEIDDDLELNEAERNERKALAQKEYFDLIETYSYIYGVATSDDARVVDDAWITTYDDIIRSGGDYKDDIVTYNKDVTDSWNNMFDEINKKMKEVVPELLGNSEGGYGLAELQTAVDDLTTESDEFKTLLTEDVIPALEQELINVDATTQAFSDQLPTIEDMQTYYEKLAQDLNAALNELIALNGTELQDKTATYTINHVDNYYTNNIPTDSTSTSTTYPSGSDNSGGPGGSTGGTPSGNNMTKSSKPLSTGSRPYSNPNYSYNLVNIHNGQRFDTGGYTGSWENGSKLAWLDQKELVLNAQDTENMLMTVSAIRDLNNSINLQALYSTLASGLVAGVYQSAAQTLEQQVSITATFPSVTDHNEIEEALNSLVNRASQYANRYN